MVRYRDSESTFQAWDEYEIHDSGEWVTFWDTASPDHEITVPLDRIESIDESASNEGKPPADWPKRRQAVLTRDGFLCQNCWQLGGELGSKDLEVHHVVPRAAKNGTHRLTNLITLCQQCHRSVHRQ